MAYRRGFNGWGTKRLLRICPRCAKPDKTKGKWCFFCGTELSKHQSKYGNRVTVFKERKYDSQREADYAKELSFRVAAGEIRAVTPQYRVRLQINTEHICYYIVDFRLDMPDGSVEMHEVKGMETDVWKIKWRIAKVLYPQYIWVLVK